MRGRQPPRAAAGQRGTRAQYVQDYKKERRKTLVILLLCTIVQSVRAVVTATRVGRMLIIQGCHSGHFFKLYVCNYRCHRHLQANFQKD